MRIKNIAGQRFGRLVVLSSKGTNNFRKALWLCRCDCGGELVVVAGHLRSGNTKSCGCLQVASVVRKNFRHGMSERSDDTLLRKTYESYKNMVTRCTDPTNKDYHNYGGRGITVCERWLDSPLNFLEDMGVKPHVKLTIERTNVNLGYYRENCCWATRTIQARNMRPRWTKPTL